MLIFPLTEKRYEIACFLDANLISILFCYAVLGKLHQLLLGTFFSEKRTFSTWCQVCISQLLITNVEKYAMCL